MRPVEIDQGNSQIAQKGEGAGRAVYELLAPPLGKNRALDDEGSVFAGFGTGRFENGMEWRSGIDLEKLMKVRDIVTAAVPDPMYGFTPDSALPKGYIQGGHGWGLPERKLAAE